MWAVVYLAQSRAEADKIEKGLSDQGVLVRVRSIGKDKNGQGVYEILVPQTEVEDAYLVLTTIIY